MAEVKNKDKIDNWLEEEHKSLGEEKVFEQLPALKFEENKITEVVVDFSKKFDKWTSDGKTKAIIPVMYQGNKYVWWLNCANPLYRQVVDAGLRDQRLFKVLRTGSADKTKYILVD